MNKFAAVLSVFLPLGLVACAGNESYEAKQSRNLPEISCVVVLPTTVHVSRSVLAGTDNGASLADGADFIDSVLVQELAFRPEFKVLSEKELDAILSGLWGGRFQQLRDVSGATGCGAVLETSVSRYRHRVGSDMSIATSAAAAFSMELIGVERGVVLWSTSFDEEQKTLLEDMFSYKTAESRGFKWLSVEDLTSRAVKKRLQKFPYFYGEKLE